MALPDGPALVEHLSGILADIHNAPYPILPSPENCQKRASVAFIIRSKPHYDHWPPSDIANAGSISEFFAQDWVKHGDPEVLFIKRASRKGDRWTSHIALPGGRRDKEDESDKVTAIRETLEEVGLDLRKHAIDCGNLPQRLVTTHWGRKPLMVLCPYMFLLASHEIPPLKLQPTEVAAVHWVPIRELVNPARRCVVFEDVSSRLANEETGLKRWMCKAILGKMMFACINLAPSESIHASESPADGIVSNRYEQRTMCIQACNALSRIYYMDIFNQFSRHIPGEGRLELWGLTLGVVSDFLDLVPPHDALTLWTYPTFAPLDARFIIWLATYRFKNRKRAELQAGTTIPAPGENSQHRFHRPSYGFASESVVMVDRPRPGSAAEEAVTDASSARPDPSNNGRPDETGLHGLGSGYITDRKAAVATMLEGYYDILRKAAAISVAGRLAMIIAVAVWAVRRWRLARRW